MAKHDDAGKAARDGDGQGSPAPTSPASTRSSTTTDMFYDAGGGASPSPTAPSCSKTMDLVRTFSFEHGLLGEGAKTKDVVGIAFPGGKTLGDAKNVKLRFDAELHADGGRRQALSARTRGTEAPRMRRADEHRAGRGAMRGGCSLGAAAVRCSLAAGSTSVGSAAAARGQPRRQAAAGAARAWPTRSQRVAFEPDQRTGDVPAVGRHRGEPAPPRRSASASPPRIGLVVGIAIGLLPYVRAGARRRCVAVLSMIPPMAILPILFIVFGLGELSKVVLIVIGIAPFLIRDLALRGRGAAARAADQGADARRLDLADRRSASCCRR